MRLLVSAPMHQKNYEGEQTPPPHSYISWRKYIQEIFCADIKYLHSHIPVCPFSCKGPSIIQKIRWNLSAKNIEYIIYIDKIALFGGRLLQLTLLQILQKNNKVRGKRIHTKIKNPSLGWLKNTTGIKQMC